MKPSRFALLTLAALLAPLAQAQKMAPGLWEVSTQMKSGSGQMEESMARAKAEMAKMPPEQRKMMEEMMAKQGMSMSGGKPNAVRVCIGKEQAERGEIPAEAKERCKQDKLERSGNTLRMAFTCTEPPSKGTGEYTYEGDKSYSGRMVVETLIKGKPEKTEMQHQGKWISADCGTLKPRGKP